MLLSKKVSDIVTDTDKGKGQSFFQTAYKITAASSVSTHHPCFLFMKILQIIWQMLELFKRGHESLSMTRRQYYRDTTKIQLVPFSKCSLAYFKHQKKTPHFGGMLCKPKMPNQKSNFAETNFPKAKTLIWVFWLAQISVFAFGKLVSAKLVSWWFCP